MAEIIEYAHPADKTTWTAGTGGVTGGKLAEASATRTVIHATDNSVRAVGVTQLDAAEGAVVGLVHKGVWGVQAAGPILAGHKVQAASNGRVKQAASPTNAVIDIDIDGRVDGGTFTVTVDGQTTSAQPYNESTGNLQADILALSTVGSGNAVVTGSAGNYTITFGGALAGKTVDVSWTPTLTVGGIANTDSTLVVTAQGGSADGRSIVGFAVEDIADGKFGPIHLLLG